MTAVLARPRLFKLLDQAARRPVIWIEGPAGSGKTTLAASWLARRGGRTLWFQLDARDQDPATFFYFLREGARRVAPRRVAPRRGGTLPLLTPEYLAGLGTYARNFFDLLFEQLGDRAALVLDDFQELPGDAPGGDAAPWAAAARDRLEARFLRLAVQAAELLRDHPAARPLLERVQDLFPQDRRLPQALARASG